MITPLHAVIISLFVGLVVFLNALRSVVGTRKTRRWNKENKALKAYNEQRRKMVKQ